MAFVFETMLEEDREKLDPKVFFNPNLGQPISSRWTIDRERDVFMLAIGGGGPGRSLVYLLSIQGEIVRFYAYGRSVAINGDQMNSLQDWWVYDIKLPASLENRRDDVLQLIEEAKTEEKSGSIYMRDGIKSVTTHFTRPPASVEQF
jgi:hypothetical protein